MFKQQATTYAGVLISYLVSLTFLRWQWEWQWAFFWMGSFFGLLLANADHLVYLFWQEPKSEIGQQAQSLLRGRRYRQVLELTVKTMDQRTRLVGHSVVFQVILVVLTFFTLSSKTSYFGQGMILGIFLAFLIDQGLSLMTGRGLDKWFWQVEFKLAQRGQTAYFLIMLLIFLYFSWTLI